MTETEIIITADSLTPAVEELLTRIVVTEQLTGREESGYLIGFDVEAANVPTMIIRALAEIRHIATEQHGEVIACEVAGIQQTDEGHRLWGTIETVQRSDEARESTRVDDITFETVGLTAWKFTLTRSNEG